MNKKKETFVLFEDYFHSGNQFKTLFDPRSRRAALVGPNAQAEAVTGTHVYSFFLEKIISGEKSPLATVQTGNEHERLQKVIFLLAFYPL